MKDGRGMRMHQNKKQNSIVIRYWTAVVCFVIILAVGFVKYMDYTLNKRTFYNGIGVEEVKIGGKTQEEVFIELLAKYKERANSLNIILQYKEKKWVLHSQDIGAKLDIENKLKSAYLIGRKGNLFQRLGEIQEAAIKGKKLYLEVIYNQSLMEKYLNDISKEVNIDVEDAKVEFQPEKKQKFIVVSEKIGKMMDISKLKSEIDQRIKSGGNITLDLPFVTVQPKVYASELEKLTNKIASFSTPLGNSTVDRKHNVFLAAASFNGKVVLPGETFSFNEITGERSLKRGYKNAPVITKDKSLEDGPGGGVCQTSTTLYNAALLAGLEIESRAHHSFPSHYVKPGFDATVNYPTTDFKFKNNRKTPVFLASYKSGNNLVVEIYGEPLENGISYKLVNEIYQVIPAPEPEIRKDVKKEFADKIKYTDEQYTWVESRKGIKVRTYRIVMKNGREIKREVIVNDYYKPIKGIIYVGTEERPKDPLIPDTLESQIPSPEKQENNGSGSGENSLETMQ